jgi:hypothetical protein
VLAGDGRVDLAFFPEGHLVAAADAAVGIHHLFETPQEDPRLVQIVDALGGVPL